MNRILIFAVLLCTASMAVGQGAIKHAPTVDQCQADQRLWWAQLEAIDPKDAHALARLPKYTVLEAWEREMSDCSDIDPQHARAYNTAAIEIMACMDRRLTDFFTRHNLWNKYFAEETGRDQ